MGALPLCTPRFFLPPSFAGGSPGFRVPLVAGLRESPSRPFSWFLWGDPPHAPRDGAPPPPPPRKRKTGGAGGLCPPDGGSGGCPPTKTKQGASWHLLKPGHEWEPEAQAGPQGTGVGKTGGAGGQSPPAEGRWGVSLHEGKIGGEMPSPEKPVPKGSLKPGPAAGNRGGKKEESAPAAPIFNLR